MPTGPRNEYDRPLSFDLDGKVELWESDTFEGGHAIQRRMLEAHRLKQAGETILNREIRSELERLVVEIVNRRFTTRALRPRKMVTRVAEHDSAGRITRIVTEESDE